MKTRVKNRIDPLEKTQEKTNLKLAVGSQVSRKFCCRSTGWSTANGRISDRWDTGRPGRSTEVQTERKFSLSVDRSVDREKTESTALSLGRPVGRPKCTHAQWCMSVDRPVDRQSNSALPAVDRAVDRTRPKLFFPKAF